MPASRVHPALVAVWVAGLSGCPTLRPETQSFRCDTGADCVAGFVCGVSGFCEPEGAPDGGGGERTVDPACGFAWSKGRALEGGWVRQFGGPGGELVAGVVALPGGGLAIAGTMPSAGDPSSQDGFVAFADEDGTFRACALLASTDASVGDSLSAIAVTAGGDVLVAGVTAGDVGGGQASELYGDVLLARYSATGERRWVRQLDFRDEGGDSHEAALELTVDGAGRTWLLGVTMGSFPGHPERFGDDVTGAFVAALDDDGTLLDGRLVGGPNDAPIPSGAQPMANGVLFASTTAGSLVGTLDDLGRPFLSVLHASESSGKAAVRVLSELVQDPGETTGLSASGALAAEGSGPRWLYGDLHEDTSVAGVSAAGFDDGFVARLGADGGVEHVWALGGPAPDGVAGGRLGSQSVWLAGSVGGPVGEGPLLGESRDAAVWSVPRTGEGPASLWQLGGAGQEQASGLFALRGDGVVVVGESNSDLDGTVWGSNDLFLWAIEGVTR